MKNMRPAFITGPPRFDASLLPTLLTASTMMRLYREKHAIFALRRSTSLMRGSIWSIRQCAAARNYAGTTFRLDMAMNGP
jgi:hypothetical protein